MFRKTEPDVKPIAEHELAAADARLKAAQQPWFDGLNDAEREMLADYKGSAGRLMNRWLRGLSDRHEVAAKAGLLWRALDRARAPADLLVYRGVGQAEAALYRAIPSGGTMLAPTFVSTSLSTVVAAKAAKVQNGEVIVLVIRKGQKGVAYVNPFPTYRYPQFEVLVNAGSVLNLLRAGSAIRLEVG